jgi:hypothetical protein
MTHTQKTLAAINAFTGPSEGDLMVLLSWGRGYDALMTPVEAIREVRDNPRIEYVAQEKWLLPPIA